ncbi:hypothetical protein [Deinococcus sonorensis]|uniref:ArsR family transcriptional regulator n=2 Tax=Deinococcus sonorensis TaxID=309891 RepID=A0AAU7UGJ3_9DEIO
MSSPEPETVHITAPGAAAFLVDPDARRFLEPFLGRDCTVARAARELGEDRHRMLYRVRQMTRLGLLSIVREEPRRGPAIKVYRSVAPRLFVPYTGAPAAELLEVLLRERAASEREVQAAMLRVMRAAHDDARWGLLLYRLGSGVFAYDAVNGQPWDTYGDEEPAVLDTTVTTPPLSRERAKALQRDLNRVLAAYTATDGPGSTRYLVRVAMVPDPDA